MLLALGFVFILSCWHCKLILHGVDEYYRRFFIRYLANCSTYLMQNYTKTWKTAESWNLSLSTKIYPTKKSHIVAAASFLFKVAGLQVPCHGWQPHHQAIKLLVHNDLAA